MSDSNGSLIIHTEGDRDLHVSITKETLDGSILYYDTVLESDGSYCFTLDSCEYDIITDAYRSSFIVTIADNIDTLCTYTETDLLVPDPGFSLDVTQAVYNWDVTLVEGESRSVTQTIQKAQNTDGIWTGASEVTLQYLNYTLGDVDADEKIGIQDAYETLYYYAKKSAGANWKFTNHISGQSEDAAFAAADVNKDLEITIDDAYTILTYYAKQSAGLEASWK
ncbi:MAG: hypothetical protein LUC50_01780 [Ruminococcus sp.]|nr:hypothetical protein [Ruminococcus sp.]